MLRLVTEKTGTYISKRFPRPAGRTMWLLFAPGIIERLDRDGLVVASLVALAADAVVGHVLYSATWRSRSMAG
jgi:hypothetical protein